MILKHTIKKEGLIVVKSRNELFSLKVVFEEVSLVAKQGPFVNKNYAEHINEVKWQQCFNLHQ